MPIATNAAVLGAVALLAASVAACDEAPTSPTRPPQTGTALAAPPTPAPRPPTPVVPLSGPSQAFGFDRELQYRVSAFTRESRFLLYENGAFLLQYVSLGVDYPGTYSQTDDVVHFTWVGSAAPSAVGTLSGDLLAVEYSLEMQHSDFENAVYKRAP